MWRKVQGVLKLDLDWQIAQTNNFKLLTGFSESLQEQSTAAVSYDAGVEITDLYSIRTLYEKCDLCRM